MTVKRVQGPRVLWFRDSGRNQDRWMLNTPIYGAMHQRATRGYNDFQLS